jgi:hypothetical protein
LEEDAAIQQWHMLNIHNCPAHLVPAAATTAAAITLAAASAINLLYIRASLVICHLANYCFLPALDRWLAGHSTFLPFFLRSFSNLRPVGLAMRVRNPDVRRRALSTASNHELADQAYGTAQSSAGNNLGGPMPSVSGIILLSSQKMLAAAWFSAYKSNIAALKSHPCLHDANPSVAIMALLRFAVDGTDVLGSLKVYPAQQEVSQPLQVWGKSLALLPKHTPVALQCNPTTKRDSINHTEKSSIRK